MEQNGWNEYQKLVLHELKRLNDNIERISDVQGEQQIAIEAMKIKSSVLATVAGFISALGFTAGKSWFDFINK